MSVLSEREIKSQLGNGILFHPLQELSIRATSLCLTASEYAYSVNHQKRLDVQEDLQNNRFLALPANDTILVWTAESIALNEFLCGSVHSRVKLVSQGIGHIGTRVNPKWSGSLCIALHNLSPNIVQVQIENPEEPIAYLIIHRLTSRSSMRGNIDANARLDVLNGHQNTEEIYAWYHKTQNKWMVGDNEKLKREMENSEIYCRYKVGIAQKILNNFIGVDLQTRWTAIASIAAIIAILLNFIEIFI